MKNFTFRLCFLAVIGLSLSSCSKDSIEEMEPAELNTEVPAVAYSGIEIEVLELVNAYRVQKGLPELQYLDPASIQAQLHNEHMMEKDEVCHHDFPSRYSALVNKANARTVSENVAYGYRTAEGAVNAWIKSEGHEKNMSGDFTHFGISVKQDEEGNFYYTNIFLRQ